MRVVQFSDPHLVPNNGEKFLGVDTFSTLKDAVALVKLLNTLPDAIVVTGDIAEKGDAVSYSRFREIFEPLPISVFVIAGNHDNLDVMEEVFSGSNISCTGQAIIGDCLCLFLDSHVQDKAHGFLSAETLLNVERLLNSHPNRPVVISLHHPIFSPCPSSGCQLQNEEELLKILRSIPRPVAVLSGHLHLAVDESRDHVRFLTSPSTFAQCEHPTSDENAKSGDFWASHKMDITRRGFRVLDFLESGEFKTQLHWF